MIDSSESRRVVDENLALYRSLYSGRYRGSTFEVLNKARITLSLVRQAGRLAQGSRVLDIGFGWGTCLGKLAGKGLRVYGIEPVSGAARAAARRLPEARLAVGEAAGLPFQDESFQAVVCSHVLEHLPGDRQAVAEMVRVLKPGGWAVVGVPGPGIGPHPLHFRTYDFAMLTETLHPLRPVHRLRRGGLLFKAVSRFSCAHGQGGGTNAPGRIPTAIRALAFWSLARLAPLDDLLAKGDSKPEEIWLLARRDPAPVSAPAEVDIIGTISKSG